MGSNRYDRPLLGRLRFLRLIGIIVLIPLLRLVFLIAMVSYAASARISFGRVIGLPIDL